MQTPGEWGNRRKMQLRSRSQWGRRKTKRLCCHGNQLKKTEEKGRDHLCQIPLMEAGFCELDLALSFTVCRVLMTLIRKVKWGGGRKHDWMELWDNSRGMRRWGKFFWDLNCKEKRNGEVDGRGRNKRWFGGVDLCVYGGVVFLDDGKNSICAVGNDPLEKTEVVEAGGVFEWLSCGWEGRDSPADGGIGLR